MSEHDAAIARAQASADSAHHRIDDLSGTLTRLGDALSNVNVTVSSMSFKLVGHMDVEEKLQAQILARSEERHNALMARLDKIDTRLDKLEHNDAYVSDLKENLATVKKVSITSVVGAILAAVYYFIQTGWNAK